ncbi:hypothetical protein CROQUDRAFT_66524 [Cronartium quercuum f. sp. fusiforme G11]|uniref:Nudix hydrolase domain-containing protein n=1 Tax=Cronartium quercuum f. sp. fusiforme G11 TaxID=708437 RepID=A0A9P6NAR0_9BASI|nr:hypothetical protein CROQUDRAFT_66524 [Cronartium quercuum f. sp. fusiforme G11]
MMSFMTVFSRCHNASLPQPPFGPHPRPVRISNGNVADEDENLIPFFLHAPDSLPTSTAFRLSPLPPRPTSRRTSANSSSSRSLVIKPFSCYLSRPDSSEDLLAQQDARLDDQAGYSPADQARDFSAPIGFLRPAIVAAMLKDNEKMLEMHSKPCWKALYPISQQDAVFDSESQPWCLAFEDWINEDSDRRLVRSEHMDRLVRVWKESGQFLSLLAGWRDEHYSIYGPKSSLEDECLPGSNVAFTMERAATGLFSFLTFGVHLTAYVIKDGEYFFWVPRRSPNKPTWPSMLDNTAAGGISAGESPTETIIRECYEEASLESITVKPLLKATGLISYIYRSTDGWVQPEVQYVYDLQLTSEIPKPCDGEATDFRLLSLQETQDSIMAGEWKPNCAAVMIDFFIRHGFLTPENEPEYLQLCTALKQDVGLYGP